MKVLFICGSPRREGNTAVVMRAIADKVAERHDVTFHSLGELPIHGCAGCCRCREELDEPGCVQDDETAELLREIIEADVVLYGSPLYGHTFSAELNALLNRHFAFLKCKENDDPRSERKFKWFSLVQAKEVGLLVTCQGPAENNAELLLMQFDRFCEAMHLHSFGKYVFPFSPADAVLADWDEEGLDRVVDDIELIAGYLPR